MNWIEAILDVIFPAQYQCCYCNEEKQLNDHGICGACEQRLLGAGIITASGALDGIFSRYHYDSFSSQSLLHLKYHNAQYLSGRLVQNTVLPPWALECLVPVPLSPAKLKNRGYNQSALLAKALSRQVSLPVLHALTKTKDTVSQTRLNREERLGNVVGAFEVVENVYGRNILLVDDVITTGGTMGECARVLKEAGAGKVYGFSVLVHSMLLRA